MTLTVMSREDMGKLLSTFSDIIFQSVLHDDQLFLIDTLMNSVKLKQ